MAFWSSDSRDLMIGFFIAIPDMYPVTFVGWLVAGYCVFYSIFVIMVSSFYLFHAVYF